MAITRERFLQGLTYEQFKAQLTETKSAVEANERSLELTDAELAPFRQLSRTMDVLVVVTNSCPDVVTNLPILGRLATDSGNLNLRIFLRDQNKDLMASYMNGPYESVPAVVFLGEDWSDLAVWIERPRSVVELRERRSRDLHERNPEFGPYGAAPSDLPDEVRGRLSQAIRAMRAETQPIYVRESIRDLGDVVTQIASAPVGSPTLWRGNLAAVAV